jgi:hypothetical protein
VDAVRGYERNPKHMDTLNIDEAVKKLSALKCDGMYLSDFLLTWGKD